MAFRLYIVPMTTTTTVKGTVRTPKYFYDGTIPLTSYGMVYYGAEPWCVIGADLSSADDATIVSQPDVDALPFNLAPNLTQSQVNNVRAFLEAKGIPAGWVSTADTWTNVVRGVLGMFMFLQRYSGIYAEANGVYPLSLFVGGVTLDTTFGALPAPVQSALLATAADLGISTTGLTGSTTVRVMLRSMADHYSTKVYNFNGTLI